MPPNQPTTSQPVRFLNVNRLSPEVYKALEKKFKPLIVSSATTPHEAGYLIGVHAVLQELREGYVVGV